jgi:hypothetical protein
MDWKILKQHARNKTSPPRAGKWFLTLFSCLFGEYDEDGSVMRMLTVTRLIKFLVLGAFIAFAVNQYFLIPFLVVLCAAVLVSTRLRCPKCGRNVYLKRRKGAAPSNLYESGSMVQECYGCGSDLRQVEVDWKMLGKKWKPSEGSSSTQRSLSKESLLGLLLFVLWLISTTIVSRGVSARLEAGIFGFMFASMGLYVLMTWRSHVNALIAQEEAKRNLFRKWFGFAPAFSEKWASTFVGAIAIFLGVIFVIGGSLMLYTFITGRDWPLHYAKWSDLWPFD